MMGFLTGRLILIHHTCFKCKRRFELEPVFVGFELNKLKKKNPSHYQAVCPACRAVNKVSVSAMQEDLDQVAEEIQQMVAEDEEQKAQAKAEQQAKAKAKRAADKSAGDKSAADPSKAGQEESGQKQKRSRKRLKA
jgi:hypothetical protein